MAGVTINYKFALLLLLITILSVSAVSADSMDENSLALVSDDFSDLSDSITLNDSLNEDQNEILSANLDDSLDDDLDENLNDNVQDNDDLSADEEPEPKDTSLEILSQDDWKIYGNEDYYVKLVDEDNNPISDALIYFRIEDPEGIYTFETAYTDEGGIAVLSLDLSILGIHNIQVSYDGDLDYNSAESVYSNVILYEKTVIQTPKAYAYRSSDFTLKLVDSVKFM